MRCDLLSETRKPGKSTLGRAAWLLMALAVCAPGLRGADRKSAKVAEGARPEVRIPLAALGYRAPGPLPRYQYAAMVGLYFLDANHLLFTFNTPGLLRRDHKCTVADSERLVRAAVLEIPSGRVVKQTQWELYDFKDFLWSLGGGKLLLRRCSRLDVVDANLEPRPLMEAAAAIEWIGFSPDRSVMAVEEDSEHQSAPAAGAKNPVFGPKGPPRPQVDVQFIQMQPLSVILRMRLPTPGAVPMGNDGVLESLAGPKGDWTVDVLPFRGAERRLAVVESACRPRPTPLSSGVTAMAVCAKNGDRSFVGYDSTGLLLWRIPVGEDMQVPRFILTRDGAHFALEWLHSTRPLAALDPLNDSVIDGQRIDVYDTITGQGIGYLRVKPVFTAGRNVDFSPDGTRIAVLNEGAIEIYAVNGLGR